MSEKIEMEYFIEKKYLLLAYKKAIDLKLDNISGDKIFDELKKFDSVFYNITVDGKVVLKVGMNQDLFKWQNIDPEHNRSIILASNRNISSQKEYNIEFEKYINYVGECIYYLINFKPEIYENFAVIKQVFGKKEKSIRSKVVYLRLVNEKTITKRLHFPSNKNKHDHKYSVCGFWRKCNGIGKDQSGNYNQIGKTWVINHIRGAGEYIYKPRIFTGSL